MLAMNKNTSQGPGAANKRDKKAQRKGGATFKLEELLKEDNEDEG